MEELTLKALVVCQLFHYLKVFGNVERLETSGTEHKVSNTIYSVAMEQYLDPRLVIRYA